MSRAREVSKIVLTAVTNEELSSALENVTVDLSGYATLDQLSASVSNIDLTGYLTESSASVTYATLNNLNEKLGKATEIKSASTSYTLILEDLGKLVEINTSSANNLTIPLESSVDFPIGSQIYIIQTGTGQTTIVPTGGVTLSGTPGLKLRAQNSGAQLVKKSSNNWVAIGDLVS
jgi:hypothetical protein